MSVPAKSACAYGRELPLYEFDNFKFDDLRLETRFYVLQVYDTIRHLNPGGQRGLEYEWLLMTMSCLGANEFESKMLMARKIFYSWTSRDIFDKSCGFSWSTEQAKLRKWYWEDFMAIATRWMRDKDEESLLRRSEKRFTFYEWLAKEKTISMKKEKEGFLEREEAEAMDVDKTPFEDWEAACRTAFLNKATMTQLPLPELLRCHNRCKAFEDTGICQHNLKIFFQSSGKFNLQLLKDQRARWHPDKFACCRKDKRMQFERLASSLFVAITPMIDEFKDVTS